MSYLRTTLATLSVLGMLGVSATAFAGIITGTVSGTLGNRVSQSSGGLDAADFPAASLLGGSFFGTFEIDAGAGPTFDYDTITEYALLSNNIEIRDEGDNTLFTLAEAEESRLQISTPDPGLFRFSLEFQNTQRDPGIPNILRLFFEGPAAAGLGSVSTAIELGTATFNPGRLASPVWSRLSVPGDELFTAWAVNVTDASLSAAMSSVPPTQDVPSPATLALFALGLVAMRRRPRRGYQICRVASMRY
jgi:MYXO-CTERM domain-containing protein